MSESLPTAEIFMHGRSQAVRLPKEFRFSGTEVDVRRQGDDVVSSSRPKASIRSALEKEGTPIGPLDTQIAAHALGLGLTLVTNDVRGFRRVPGLQVGNRAWPGARAHALGR